MSSFSNLQVAMRRFLVAASLAVFPVFAAPTLAQEVPPLEIYQAMLEANKASGWVQFREYDGQQLVYFTPLVTMHCRLEEVRYSVNSVELDQVFELPTCNPALPFSLPSDAGLDDIAIQLSSQEAKFVAVQVSYTGGKKQTDVTRFAPCKNVGESTCGRLLDSE